MRRQLLNKFIGNFNWMVTGVAVTCCGIVPAYSSTNTHLNSALPTPTGLVNGRCRNEPVTFMATGCSRTICRVVKTLRLFSSVTFSNMHRLFFAQRRYPAAACVRIGM